MSKTARELTDEIVLSPKPLDMQIAIESALIEYAKAEREACVKIALEAATENAHSDKWVGACRLISERIRERGE